MSGATSLAALSADRDGMLALIAIAGQLGMDAEFVGWCADELFRTERAIYLRAQGAPGQHLADVAVPLASNLIQ